MTQAPAPSPSPVELSLVVPALNEADNLAPLVEQVHAALIADAGLSAELIIIDDGSTDNTPERLADLLGDHPWLRALRHDQPRGQSAAMHAGIAAARGRYIATLDADLQNDPADLPRMLDTLKSRGVDMVQGDRSANRRDNLVRRWTSTIGRAARRAIVGDRVRDTGCSARAMTAHAARALPLQFKGMHRFIPAYVQLAGGRVLEVPVHHRPRHAGQTKYGLGISQRALSGLLDCFAVAWMRRRIRLTTATELTPDPPRRRSAPASTSAAQATSPTSPHHLTPGATP